MFKYKKTIIFIIIVVALVGWFFYSRSKKPTVTYTTEKAQKGNLVRTVSVTGEIAVPEEADLSFKLSGQIKSISVDVGDRVEKGQKIATIDRGTLPQQLSQAQHEVDAQKRTLGNMKRNNSGFSYLQIAAQREVIKKAEAAVQAIVEQINETTLYAPISGTVIKKNVEVGEITVANAVTANTSVVTIASDGDLEADVDVSESDILKVALGQKAIVTLDALPTDDKIEAEVMEIEPASTVIQDVVYYKVKLKFNSQDSRFKVGMSADADINTAEKDNVVMVPQRAVKNDGQDYVEILKADNVVERVNVVTGLEGDDGMIEIKSGLSGGEDVVVLSSGA